MPFDFHIPLSVALVGGGIIYVIFMMPPLTNPDSALSSTGTSAAQVEAIMVTERAFCERQPEAVDCRCFAKRAGAVLSHNQPQVPGATYANRQQLARGQAMRSC